MEWTFFLDPHTQGVTFALAKACAKCGKYKHAEEGFYANADACRLCYDRKWMEWNDEKSLLPVEVHLRRACQRANRRSRHRRSTGGDIAEAEVAALWERCGGACEHCDRRLTFKWHPRRPNDDYAVLDRVDTAANRSYKGNARFLCTACNTEKGAFDLVAQQNRTIRRLRKRLRRRARPGPHVRGHPHRCPKNLGRW